MAWEQRKNRIYYYRKLRVGAKVVSIYLGNTPEAHATHRALQDRKQPRQEQEAWQELERQIDELKAQIDRYPSSIGLHRQNYGPWRKKRAA